MDSIIATKTQWGGPGGGTHDIYLSLWGENGIFYLELVIEDREESALAERDDFEWDNYEIFDPDGEVGEGALVDGVEIEREDEFGSFFADSSYCSVHYPEKRHDVPDDVEFTDPSDPSLKNILGYFDLTPAELEKECEKLGESVDSNESKRSRVGLIGSTRRSDLKAIEGLLASGKSSQDELDTALFLAAWYDDPGIIKLLINAGADVNRVHGNVYSDSERTALMAAASNFCAHAVEPLLDAGADPYIENECQETVFDMDDVLEISEPVEEVKETNEHKPEINTTEGRSRIYFGKQKGESLEEFVKRVQAQLLQGDMPKTL